MRKSNLIEIAIYVTIIGLLTWGAYGRNEIWKSVTGLWADCVKKSPEKVRPHVNYGVALMKEGKTEEAIFEFQQALLMDPDSADAHNNLGSIFFQCGRLDEAAGHFFAALRIDPKFAPAHNNLGILCFERRIISEAIYHFKEAIRIDPDFSDAKMNLETINKIIERRNKDK